MWVHETSCFPGSMSLFLEEGMSEQGSQAFPCTSAALRLLPLRILLEIGFPMASRFLKRRVAAIKEAFSRGNPLSTKARIGRFRITAARKLW